MENQSWQRKIRRWQKPVDPLRDLFLLAGRVFPGLYDLYIHRVHGRPDPWIYLVYSNGHSATSSLYSSLVRHGLRPVIQLHMLSPEQIASTAHYPRGVPLMYYRALIERRKRLKIISVVRNPVDLYVSGFFRELANAGRYDSSLSLGRCLELFCERYAAPPDDWFTVDLQPVLGIDLYRIDYSPERLSLRVKTDWFDLLVIRLEMDEAERNNRVASFLEIDSFSWDRETNAARGKDYFPLYKQFKDRAVIPDPVLNGLLSMPYAKHFYSEPELSAYRERWSSPRIATQ